MENTHCKNFIQKMIESDISEGGKYYGKTVHTRFPPEPNGYLHIGHAKALCIDFGMAEKFQGKCNLRMDDTNPTKEDVEFVEAIKTDVKWLGFDWEDRFYYASDYFDKMFEIACELIEKGFAYVCELSSEQVKAMRGDLKTPAQSPFRDRPKEESRDLFIKMKNGEFADGAMTLRAKINLATGNFNMRDPVLYRISREYHYRTKNDWCIYPMYDYAHPIEDALEGITHSLCSLEFEDHRPLYDWVVNNMSCAAKPTQTEFARLNITKTLMSKRKLKRLVESKTVIGWDDPRMPTLSGLRRRGYTPESIKNFCEKIGVSKVISTVDHAFLEYCLREDLNLKAKRVMAVLDPIKLIITNLPDGFEEELETENNPNEVVKTTRKIKFTKELFIERDDFMVEPVKKFFRLYPGNCVRLKSAYIITCTGFKTDEHGNVIEVHAEYDPQTKSGINVSGKKVKATIHWVSAKYALNAEVRIYENLFKSDNPEIEDDFLNDVNPNSLKIMKNCRLEESLKTAKIGESFQFMRLGYFCKDIYSTEKKLIFNRSVILKDSYKPN